MLTTDLVHSRLFRELGSRFQPSTCAIYQLPDPPAQDSTGAIKQVWPDDYSVLAGHAAIPCTFGVEKGQRGSFVEQRQADSTYTRSTHYALLDGHYPLITERMKARIGSEDYDIQGVAHQAHAAVTRLALELIT